MTSYHHVSSFLPSSPEGLLLPPPGSSANPLSQCRALCGVDTLAHARSAQFWPGRWPASSGSLLAEGHRYHVALTSSHGAS